MARKKIKKIDNQKHGSVFDKLALTRARNMIFET
jgi:hypothetical protein